MTGLEAILRYPVTGSFIDKSACLPASLVLRSSGVVLHADQHEVIQQKNEKARVGVTKGRKDAR